MVTTVSERVLHAPTPVAPVAPVSRRSSAWVVVLGVVVALIAGFSAGVLAQQAVETEPQGLATEAVVQVVDDAFAAASTQDPAVRAAVYTADAVFLMTDSTGAVLGRYVGSDEIALEMGRVIALTRTGEVLQQGDMVTTTYSALDSEGSMTFDLQGGKIAAQLVMIETFK